jgi:hypothetical protein
LLVARLARRKAKKIQEEICFDFAISDGDHYDEFDCQCSYAVCRERVTGDDWQMPELQQRFMVPSIHKGEMMPALIGA